MLQAARTVARRTAVGVGGIAAVGAVGATAYAYSEQGAGFRREGQFWRTVGPIVFDYYWRTASTSPYVRYQTWVRSRAAAAADDDEEHVYNYEQERKQIVENLHQRHAPEIFQVMLDLKGLYVKLGQVLSVTVLPVPEAYRVLFRTLQSDVPGWETFDEVVQPVLEKEFGKPLQELFDYVDPVPCGAASIGQAHRARLKATTTTTTTTPSDNRDVIIKVQYPDASWQVPADIQCVGDFLKICVWAGVVDESVARLSFDEFSRQFLSELDYERERCNLQQVHESSLDPNAPYKRRNVVIPKVYPELCTKKVITMSFLPGPKLEAEAKRQLALFGIDTSKNNITSIVRDAAKDAADHPNEAASGELVRRVTKQIKPSTSPFSWKLTASRIFGQVLGVDSILLAARFVRRLLLWSQVAAVASIHMVPSSIVPSSWDAWAAAHRHAAAQAKQLSLTKEWMDALFDVHGHQIFNLGLFNADCHPGNIIIIEEDDDKNDTPCNKIGLIDYGQCKRLSRKEQVLVAQLVLSVANNESDLAVATAFRNMGITTKNDSTEFLAKFGRLMFGPFRPEHMSHSWHQKLHRQDRVLYFPKELSMVYRTSLLLRGLAVSLQLNYSVGDAWKEHAQQTLERNPQIVQEMLWGEEETNRGGKAPLAVTEQPSTMSL